MLVLRGWAYLRSDREFDSGSRIETQQLSAVQIENLVLLGKVWGLAKYHHPKVTTGKVHWDYELFRVMPAILQAPNPRSAALELNFWLRSLGEIQACDDCGESPSNVQLPPDTGWIRDATTLGPELSDLLAIIKRTRPSEQHYVSYHRATGQSEFPNEAQYRRLVALDAGYRLLALFRLWNVIEYWFPYRDVIGEDWDGVLREFIPRVMAAEGPGAYRREMVLLTARVNDGHALFRGPGRPPAGRAQIPVSVRFVENRAVVTGYLDDVLGPATGLLAGDILLRFDGVPVDSLVTDWQPYYGASTEAARLSYIGRQLTKGPTGAVRVDVQRAGDTLQFNVARSRNVRAPRSNDLPGPAFQMLTDEVAYIKLSAIESSSIDSYLRRAAGAEVLVVDIRNRPAESVVHVLGERLITEPTEFVRMTRPHPGLPGGFVWNEPLVLNPREPHFSTTVVVLVEETSQSHAEFTAMALRAAPKAILVGSATAGANGNLSFLPLPGGHDVIFSGLGVFHPDGRPTQRVGLVPDVLIRPTIAGIRDGRDEVLEAGVSHALGREFRYPTAQEASQGSSRQR